MLRRVLSSLLERVIGSYVEDVNSEKLSIGLLNGNLALSELTLKKDSLHTLLNLPLVLEQGTVGKISVHIPYTHLWSQPWQLVVENVDLVAHLSAAELSHRVPEHRIGDADQLNGTSDNKFSGNDNRSSSNSFDHKGYLAQMEQKWWQTIQNYGVNDTTALAAVVAMNSNTDSSWWSYVASFGYGIVRSIQVEIHNVNLRIVDRSLAVGGPDIDPLTSSFGTFTLSLQHLVIRTPDESKADLESKLIMMDSLCVSWSEMLSPTLATELTQGKSSGFAAPALYVLPPSSLTGQLRRNRHPTNSDISIVDERTRQHSVQIEFDACFGDLQLQLSRDLCIATVHLAELMAHEQNLKEQFSRRPNVPVYRNTQKWWRYAAGEIRPPLRSYFNATMHTTFEALAGEAKLNVRYVNAYTNYLVRGLIDASEVPSGAEQEAVSAAGSDLRATSEDSDDNFRRQADHQWPVSRIATLRLVAMRRAAATLQKGLKPRFPSTSDRLSPDELTSPMGLSSSIPRRSFTESAESSSTSLVPPASVASGTMSWYAWWRYSSLLGIRSFWYGSEPDAIQPVSESLGKNKSDEARPSLRDAVFELLDELAITSDKWDPSGPPDFANPSDVETNVVFKVTCRVDGCSFRLTDDDTSVTGPGGYIRSAFVSISGQRMVFTLEAEPWRRSAHFAASVESFTVRDERHSRMSSHMTEVNGTTAPWCSRSVFPFVVFPRVVVPKSPHFAAAPMVTRPTSAQSSGSTISGLFWLVYEILPSDADFDFSLEIKTDPLHVVYQPELIKCILDFTHAVLSAASPGLESSARQQYQSIKERTQANIRAFLDDTKQSSSSAGTPERSATRCSSPSWLLSSAMLPSQRKPRRWKLNLDISAPRLLLPDYNVHFAACSSNASSHPSINGLLCNFGRLRIHNWPVDDSFQKPGKLKEPDRSTDSREHDVEDDVFLTPCGSPASQSDAEEEPVADPPNAVIGTCDSAEVVSWPSSPEFYESYALYLDDIHAVVGTLDVFKQLGLWTDPVESEHHSDDQKSSTSSGGPPVIHITTSRLMAQSCLVDRLNLHMLISRRMISLHDLISRLDPSVTQAAGYPPSLWITLKVERCVLRLSDSKLANLLKCLQTSRPPSTSNQTPKLPKKGIPTDHSHTSSRQTRRPFVRINPPSLKRCKLKWTHSPQKPSTSILGLRKRLITVLEIKELIVQLENKGCSTAECRIEGATATWIRLAGRGAGYQGRFTLRGLSVADATANFGGDYDMLVTSHRNFRLNSHGQMEVLSNESVPCSPRVNSAGAPGHLDPTFIFCLHPPEGHSSPVFQLPFESGHRGKDVLQLYFDWNPASTFSDTVTAVSGMRTVHLHLDRLDIVFNLHTLREIQQCLSHMSALATAFSNPGGEMDDAPSPIHDVPGNHTAMRTKLCVGELNVLIIRVLHDSHTLAEGDEDKGVERAERILMVTFQRIHYSSLLALSRRTRLQLYGIGFSNTQQSTMHPYLLHAGQVSRSHECDALKPSPIPAISLNLCWKPSASHLWIPTTIHGICDHFTYVHCPATVAKVSAWMEQLPSAESWSTVSAPKVKVGGFPSCIFSLQPRITFTLFHTTFLLPNGAVSCSDVLLAPMGYVHVTNADRFSSLPICATDFSTPKQSLTLHVKDAALYSADLGKLVKLHPPKLSIAPAWLRIIPSLTPQHKAVDCVLSPTSFRLQLTSILDDTIDCPRWKLSHEKDVSEFMAKVASSTVATSPAQIPTIPSCESLIQLQSWFTCPVRLRLTQQVCTQVVQTLTHTFQSQVAASLFSDGYSEPITADCANDDVTYETKQAVFVAASGPPLSWRMWLHSLHVDIMADVDICPVSLARLEMQSVHFSGTRDPAGDSMARMFGRITIGSVCLVNLLPPEHDHEEKRPMSQAVLLSITSADSSQYATPPRTLNPVFCSLSSLKSAPMSDDEGITNRGRAARGYNSARHKQRCLSRSHSTHELLNHRSTQNYAEDQPYCKTPSRVAAGVELLSYTPSEVLPGSTEQFVKAKYFSHLDCTQLSFRLCPQPWVLILDFLRSFFSTVSHSSPTDTKTASICSYSMHSAYIGNARFILNANQDESADIVECVLQPVHLRYLDCVDRFDLHLPEHRQLTPEGLLGPYSVLSCEMGDLSIRALLPQESTLYAVRLCSKRPVVGSEVKNTHHFARSFTLCLVCSAAVDGVTRTIQDTYFYARMAPLQYVHTHPFALCILDSLNSFLLQKNFLFHIRDSSLCPKVSSIAQRAPQIWLDVIFSEPCIVLPVSPHSAEVLVISATRLAIINHCLNVDSCSYSADQLPLVLRDAEDISPNSRCVFCESNAVRSTHGFVAPGHRPDGKASEAPSSDFCLVDRIHLSLNGAFAYHAKHRFTSPPEAISGPHISSNAPDLRLHFPDYNVQPSVCQRGSQALLFNPTDLQLLIERNLSSAHSHQLPNWRISAPLHGSDIRLSPQAYRAVRGLLIYNFGGILGDDLEDMGTIFPDGFPLSPGVSAPTGSFPSFFPPKPTIQTAIINVPWVVWSFEIPLDEVRLIILEDNSVNNQEWCRFEFQRGYFFFDKLSNQRSTAQLSCPTLRLVKYQLPSGGDHLVFGPTFTPHLNGTVGTTGPSAFRIRYSSSPFSSTLSVCVRSMELQFHYPFLTHLLDVICTAPICPPNPLQQMRRIDSGSTTPLEYQLCFEDCTVVLLMNPSVVSSNAVLLRATAFIARSQSIVTCSACVPFTQVCLHTVRLSTHTSPSSPSFLGTFLRLRSAQLRLSSSPPIQQPTKTSASDLQKPNLPSGLLTNTIGATRLCADLSAQRQQHPPQPPKFELLFSTSNISIALSPSIIELLARLLRSLADQCKQSYACENRSYTFEIDGHFDGNSATDANSTSSGHLLNRFLRLPEMFIDFVSPLVHTLHFNSVVNLRLFDTDYGTLIPLFEVFLKDFTFNWLRSQPPSIATLNTVGLSVNYYNRDLMAWEPAIEPWDFSLHWSRPKTNACPRVTAIAFHSDKIFNFNLTLCLLLLIRRLMARFSQGHADTIVLGAGSSDSETGNVVSSGSSEHPYDSQPKVSAPFRLYNRTGSTVWFKLLPADDAANLPEIEGKSGVTGSRNQWHRLDPQADTGDLLHVTALNSQFHPDSLSVYRNTPPKLLVQVSGWRPTYPIAVDRLGIYFRTLERDPTVDVAFEDKHFVTDAQLPLFTRLIIEVLLSDSPVQHLVVLRSALTITNDLSDGHQLLVGLQHSSSTSTAQGDMTWSSQLCEPSELVQRIPLLLIPSGQTSALPLSWAALHSTGFGTLCFCPTLIPTTPNHGVSSVVGNYATRRYATYDWAAVCLPNVTDVGSDSGSGRASLAPTSAHTASNFSLELDTTSTTRHLDWTRLKQPGEVIEANLLCRSGTATSQIGLIHATLDNSSVLPSLEGDHDEGLTTSVPPLRCTSNPPRNGSGGVSPRYHMSLVIVRDHFPLDPLWVGVPGAEHLPHPKCLPGHHITVSPIIRITNLLPCELTYFFADTSVCGSLAAGHDACVHELPPAETLRFGVYLDGFPKCEPLDIPPNTYDRKVLLRLQDPLGRPLELQLRVISRSGAARHLTVSAVIWLLNDSGLPLVFAQSSSFLESSSNVAAGQYGEHELARSVCPLLFSFANKQDGYLLRVRIGRGAHSNPSDLNSGSIRREKRSDYYPVWSPPISLDKSGVDMLQLRVLDSSKRPALVYHVGFEVRPGRGRHAVTTIVTFKPRYIVENRSGVRMDLTQRRCLQTRTGDSAIVTLGHGCSQAFHWPRDDLDRLLCLRVDMASEAEALTDQHKSLWSGGFQIDRPHAFTLMLNFPSINDLKESPGQRYTPSTSIIADRLLVRVVVVLREATFHVLIQDANALPPPFRLENMSPVALFYQQITSTLISPLGLSHAVVPNVGPPLTHRSSQSSQSILDASLSEHFRDSVDSTKRATSRECTQNFWCGGAVLSYLSPQTSVPYALEEPLFSPSVMLRVQGGTSASYNLEQAGSMDPLMYDNFVYLTVIGPLTDGNTSSCRSDSFSGDIVFDVMPSSNRVVYSSRIPGRRSQLWWLSDSGFVCHEGSSSPLEPGERAGRKRQSGRQFVLDLDVTAPSDGRSGHAFAMDPDTERQFEVAQLTVAPLNKRRKKFQTWRIDQHGLLVNDALFCVQVYREQSSANAVIDYLGTPILVARPRVSATRLISPMITPAIIFPLWLRPGSGKLRVYLYLDGVTRVLRIEDEADSFAPSVRANVSSSVVSHTNSGKVVPSSRWSTLSHAGCQPSLTNPQSTTLAMQPNASIDHQWSDLACDDSQFRIMVSLPAGIGCSIISAFAEELVYASFVNVRLSFLRAYSLDPLIHPREWSGNFNVPVQPDGLHHATGVLAQSNPTHETDDQLQEDIDTDPSSLLDWVTLHSNTRGFTTSNSLSDFVGLDVEHIQINNQLPGATLPVLLFTNTGTASTHGRGASGIHKIHRRVIEGRPVTNVVDAPCTLTVAFQREVQSHWKVQLFKAFQVNVSPVIIQAEELLLLKLIQFWQLTTGALLATATPSQDSLDENVTIRTYSSTPMDNGHLLWFDRLFISCIPLRLSVQTAKQSLTSSNLAGAKRLLPSLMSFSNADVQLEPLRCSHILETGSYLCTHLITHYKLQLRAHAVHIFGSVDFLGNPIGLINDLTSGISGLVELDVGSLIRHVAHGFGDSTAKVAGSFSQLLNAISLDEQHQYKRAAILGGIPDSSPLIPQRSTSQASHSYAQSHPTGDRLATEDLDEFEIADNSALVPALSVDSSKAIAPLTAGLRGFMHGFVGGMTSMVTQPYKGIQEDQFKGFVYGLGRGLLGTVTKPLGGILDLVSGAMTSLSEVTRFSTHAHPRRRRPRRSGLSSHALQPLAAYQLDEAVAQLQLHRLTLFTTTRQTSRVTVLTSLLPPEWLEIGEEVHVDSEDEENEPTSVGPGTSVPLPPLSRIVQTTVDGAWLTHTFNSPECVFHVLPVQRNGVIVILTDRTLWCLSSPTLSGWVMAKEHELLHSVSEESNLDPTFYLTEHATLMFMLPYHRVDMVRVQKVCSPTTESCERNALFYVIFIGDSGISAQRLRCDHLRWASRLATLTLEAQFRFIHAAFSLLRSDTASNTLTGSHYGTRYPGVPTIHGFPFALAYAPTFRQNSHQ